MSSTSEIHQYIQNVLEKDDHGENRVMVCEAETLNHALDQHSDSIAKTLKPQYEKLRKIPPTLPEDHKITVHNYLGNIEFQCYQATPTSLDELIDVLVKANQKNLKVRAVGAFHSWSPICETNGYLIQTSGLSGTTPIITTTLRNPSAAAGYYDVLGGTTLKDVAKALETDGRALINMGGYSGLHIVGVTCTGAHGSGITVPPLAAMIRGVTLVSANFGPDGKPIVYRIEPSNGITDPQKHPQTSVLVQDDATFNAILVGLGAFGVVYSVTIETVPFYWIREFRESVDWSDARKRLQQGPSGDILSFHNAEVWLNAYNSRALITKREVVTSPPKPPLWKRVVNAIPCLHCIVPLPVENAHDALSPDPPAHAFDALLDAIPALKRISESIVGTDGIVEEGIRDVGKLLGLLLKQFPRLVPAVINIALDTQNHHQPLVAKYYDIYDVGFANRFPVICCEISYPIDTYIAGVDAALSSIQHERNQDIANAIVGFLSVRFTSSTSATLSMGYSDDPSKAGGRCYLEIFGLSDFFQSLQIYEDMLRPIQEESINKYSARLHWGQYLTPVFKAQQYRKHDPVFASNIAAVRTIADQYDPGHMMTNTFLDQVVFTT